jgi:hypothetical protein
LAFVVAPLLLDSLFYQREMIICVSLSSHLESAEDASGREFAKQRRRWFAVGGGGVLLHDFGDCAQPSVHLVQPHGHALHLRLLRAHQLVHFGVKHLEPLLTPMEINRGESSNLQVAKTVFYAN